MQKYRKDAEQGDPRAQYNLGCCYELGDGVEKDLSQAYIWYYLAAEKGNELAAYRLYKLNNDYEKQQKMEKHK